MAHTSASSVQASNMVGTIQWFVYMLLCDKKTFYVGITNEVRKRILQHLNKQNISTKKFSKLQIVYLEKYDDKFQAAKREKQLKGWSHAKKQKLIDRKLGINACHESVEVISEDLNP